MTQFTPLAMTKKLVSYDTTSRDSNLDLIMFAVDYLKGLGVDATLSRMDVCSVAAPVT